MANPLLFPDPAGTLPTLIIRHHARHAYAAHAAILDTTPPPPPRNLTEAASHDDATEWKASHDAETRHDTELRMWTDEDPLAGDKPLLYQITFTAKANIHVGLERYKVHCVIRGNRMKTDFDIDATRTASHIPSKAVRKLLVCATAAKRHAVESWDIPGANMRAPNDPTFRMTMRQPPRANGALAAPGKIYVLRRAMPGDPAASVQWDAWRDYCLKN